MKKIQTYKVFNESLRDKLKGKSEDELMNKLNQLSPVKMFYMSIMNHYTKGALMAMELLEDSGDLYSRLNGMFNTTVQYNNYEIAKLLLLKGVDVNDVGIYDLLLHASDNDNLDMIKLLFDNGLKYDPYELDNALYNSAHNNFLSITKYLLEKGADPDQLNLIEEIKNSGNEEMYKLLYSYNVYKDINESLKDKLKGKSDEEILKNIDHMDVFNRIKKIKYYNLDKKYIPSNEEIHKGILNLPKGEQMYRACQYGILDIVKELLKDKNYSLDSIDVGFRLAAKHGYYDIVKEILDDGRVDPTALHCAALLSASEHGHIDIVKLLMKDKKLDPSGIKNYAIRNAHKNGHYDIVDLLLKDDRVRQKLTQNQIWDYEHDVNIMTESLRYKMKGIIEESLITKFKIFEGNWGYDDGWSWGDHDTIYNYGGYETPEKSYDDGWSWGDHDTIYNYGGYETPEKSYEDTDEDKIRTWKEEGTDFFYNYSVNDFIDLLKRDKIQLDKYDNRILEYSVIEDRLDLFKELMKHEHMNLTFDHNYLIRKAVRSGKLEFVKELLKYDEVDPSDDNSITIRTAAQNGHTEIVKLLLQDKRIDPTAYYNYALMKSISNGHIEIANILLDDERVDPGEDNDTLIYALHGKYYQLVERLMKYPSILSTLNYNYLVAYKYLYNYVKKNPDVLKHISLTDEEKRKLFPIYKSKKINRSI